MDTLGTTIAYMVAHMNTRQGMLFFSGLTLKTVDDHCGYSLPWDPLQHLSGNNAPYHDIHHQSWGIKVSRATTSRYIRLIYYRRISLNHVPPSGIESWALCGLAVICPSATNVPGS